MSDIKGLYDQIRELYGRTLPRQVVAEIADKIPKELEPDEDAYDKYVYITKIYTYGEYMSCLSMYDKCYSSPLHQYGEKEELLYSYHNITPGLIKDHKIRNNRGKFIHDSMTKEPSDSISRKSNVFLIKRTQWDSFKGDKKMVTYTIYVYSQDGEVESRRKQQAESTLANLNEQIKAANEKGVSTHDC